MIPAAHILIAEDEAKIAAILSDYLVAADMQVSIVDDGGAVLERIAALDPDLIILDLMLPHVDGLSICRELRRTNDVPVIMLTARVEEIDRLLGLELGADDYICKPFSPREVVARVKAILRRSGKLEAAALPAVVVDNGALRVTINGHRLDLTPVEFKLFATLSRHPGRVYRRDALLDLIYDDFREVSDRTIDSHVKNLRRKLEHALPGRQAVHSVYGVGYRYELD